MATPSKCTLLNRAFVFGVVTTTCAADGESTKMTPTTEGREHTADTMLAPRAWLDGCPGGPHSVLTTLMFMSINLSYPGLENARAAFAKNNLTEACNEVAQYYADASTAG